MNAYGGLPGATGYHATLTLRGSDGTSVAGWSGRSAITSVEVTFAGVGSKTPWQPRSQLDDLGWFVAG